MGPLTPVAFSFLRVGPNAVNLREFRAHAVTPAKAVRLRRTEKLKKTARQRRTASAGMTQEFKIRIKRLKLTALGRTKLTGRRYL